MIACLVTSNSKIKIQSSDSKNIKEMCIEANHFLSEDMKKVFKNAVDSEESPLGKQVLNQLNENLSIAASDDDGILTKNGTMIYGKEDDAVTIGVQPLKDETGNVSFEGVRTLITINESTASKEYTFAYDLPEGYSLITAKDYYCDIIDNEAVNENDYDTGEVYIVNKDNVIDTVIDAAWAVDANGNDVDTYYVVNENILTQVVNFDEKTTFPVIADPSAWKIAKCAAAIGLIVAGTVIAAAKVAKVVKYIKTLGGVKKAAKLVVLAYAAGDAKKYARHIGGSFKNLCEIILGIDTIKSQCKF